MLQKIKDKITKRLKQVTIGYTSNEEMINSLRKQGVTIGDRVYFYMPSSITVDVTRPYLITIGDDVQITKDVTILTHGYDWSVIKGIDGSVLGSCGEVVIGNNVFIGTKSTILKNVHIGDNVIIAAGSLVNKDCESGFVYGGVPAKKLMTIDEHKKRIVDNQINEAFVQVSGYYKKYSKLPPKELLDEFFFLFEDRKIPLIKEYEKKLRLLGNYEKSKDLYLSGKYQKFSNYDEFMQYCMNRIKLTNDIEGDN